MPSNDRLQRINEELMRDLSSLISNLKDPRVHGMVSITRVDCSRDLGKAKVYISVLDAQRDGKEVLAGLKSAAGFLRHEVGQSLGLRHTPAFEFIPDDSIREGTHILELLRRVEEAHPDND